MEELGYHGKRMKIIFQTSDNYVWNWQEVCTNVTQAMIAKEDIEMLTNKEGPCIRASGIEQYLLKSCKMHNYDPAKIKIVTINQIEQHDQFKIEIQKFYDSFIDKKLNVVIDKTMMHKHFGIFVMKSNAPRLDMASYLYKHHKHRTTMTYHYDSNSVIHRNAIGIEELIQDHQHKDITTVADFIAQCPINNTEYNLDENSDLSPQLLAQDHNQFLSNYNNFFVEIACETFYSGRTFLPSEKTWRPVRLLTPFMVHGPKNYLKNLREMGFQTFDRWWNEGYSEDDPVWQLKLIKENCDEIATWSMDKCQQIYEEMQPVLHHNKKHLEQSSVWSLETQGDMT